MAESGNASQYLFERVQQSTEGNDPIDMDAIKTMASDQRKEFRDIGTKKEYLSLLQLPSADFDALFLDPALSAKRAKQQTKDAKAECARGKEEKRRARKNCEKHILSLFQLRQQITAKRTESQRLSSEHTALLSQSSQSLSAPLSASAYSVSDLLTHSQCRDVLCAQQQRLEALTLSTAQHRDALQSAKTQHSRLNYAFEELNRQRRSYTDTLALRRADSLCDSESVRLGVDSLCSLIGVDGLEVRAATNEISFCTASGHSVTISVSVDGERVLGLAIAHLADGTKLDEMGAAVMAQFAEGAADIEGVARSVLCFVSGLERRYADIARLHSEYESRSMLPWLPESNQLVFKFEFGQGVRRVSVPLVLSMAWHYPAQRDSVAVEHYNCTLVERDEAAEREWKEQLRLTMQSVQGKFQDDIVRFVGAIYHRLQAFADSKA